MPAASDALTLPPGTIDCHVHVIGDGITHPYRAGSGYRPSPAPLEALQAFHQRWGIAHAVLVQISVHGFDNGLMLESLQRAPERLRGVAVTTPRPGDRLLAQLKESGVVGLRLNLMNGGGPDLADLARYGALCRDAGFHLQLYLDGLQLPDLAAALRSLGVTLVFDHFGGIPAEAGPAHPAVATLCALLAEGAWVKLSAPYRVCAGTSEAGSLDALGRRLLAAAPERCIWASDWPHVATERIVRMEDLIETTMAIVGEGPARDAVFSGNAIRLYGF